jgi:ABC-type lipoprotein export system ATPase subunit
LRVDDEARGKNNFVNSKEMKTIIQLKDVTKVYNGGETPFTALKDVNFEIKSGEFLGITGKSGAGKTTLLNMISGVSTLTSGEVLFNSNSNGKNRHPNQIVSIHNLDQDQMALWRGENIGIIYQSFELMPTLNLAQNVMLPTDFAGNYRPQASKEQALELLELVDILEHAYKIPAHISGGQKQRVAIARALVNDPPLIIADEPTGNLDSVTAENIFQIFEKLVDRGKTVVMVTHDASLAGRFSRGLHIVDGVVSSAAKDGNNGRRYGTVQVRTEAKEPAQSEVGNRTSRTLSDRRTPVSSVSQARLDQKPDHPAILLRGVDKVYENAAGKFVALKSVDMQIDYGQFISIVGKSGSGKSTLINMISGIDFPTAGEVIVGNQPIYQMTESQRALWRGRNLGVVFQFFQLLPTLSLLENTMLPMDYCRVFSRQERPKRALDLLEAVGLADEAHKLPASMSSGQQQSAAIARALATDPSIILADEPTGNLDSRSAEKILNLFEALAANGKTILIVTHDPSITQRTDQTVILSDGEIIDQVVARALPLLSHPQMLEATHRAQKQSHPPNTTIISQGDPVENFYMIVEGEVEIVVCNDRAGEMSLARLGPGQFFGEVELMGGHNSIASVRAAKGGTQVAALPKAEFFALIDGSPLTRAKIREVAESRSDENRQRRTADCQ